MSKIEMKAKFPCGYEVEVKVSSLFLEADGSIVPDECPLHGKSCPKLEE